MQRMILRSFWMLLIVLLSACATQAGRTSNTVISTAVAPSAVPIPSPLPADVPASTVLPLSLDADGYHVIGDPAAPIVMTDYSDYF